MAVATILAVQTTPMRGLRPHARLLLLAVVTLVSAVPAHAQPRAYSGGAVTFLTQTHSTLAQARSTTVQLGGTTWGGSLLFGVSLSPRLSAEFEPLFVGSFDGQYTYSPSPVFRAQVITRRRDTFFTFQLRTRTGVLEPVVGVSYLRGTASRHATFIESGRPYFDDRQSQHALAVAGGFDASVKLTAHFFFVPTFRAFVVARPSVARNDVIAQQTSGGPFVFRYGAGVRVAF
jgi:hypothetical protein